MYSKVSIMFKMDNTKEKAYVNHPQVLDDTNYDYYKALMVSFLNFMDRKTWKTVINGWFFQR